MRHRIEYLVLAAITVLAVFLRFYKLGNWSYWVDELYTLRASFRPYAELLDRPYWIITRLSIDLLGVNAFSLRFFPSLFGIITIPLLYFPFKAIFDQRVSLLAVFLIAISPWHIYLSQLARWYSLLLLVSTLSLFAFYFFTERNSPKYLIFSILLFIFAFFLHLTAGFILLIGVIYLFLLSRLPYFRPEKLSVKKVNIFLLVLAAVVLMFIPRFIQFVAHWKDTQQILGYWGSTPINFTLKVLYHLTPSIAVIAFFGILLLLFQKERRGLFLAIYGLLPPIALIIAAAFRTNVSAKYVFFTLPGLMLATSYLCFRVIEQIKANKMIVGLAIIAAIILPSLQTDFMYFTSSHGNRDRLKEAVQYIKDRSTGDEQIFPLYLFENPVEAKFYFQTMANLEDFRLDDEQIIFPSVPEEIDLTKKTWVVTIGKSIPPNATEFYKWIADYTNLVAEFTANKGPENNTVKVFLHRPQYRLESTKFIKQQKRLEQ
jgi:uncharacterized membrane protein